MGIEVEVRAFLTDKQYKDLTEFFNENAEFLGEDEQETHYLSGGKDLRIQKNNKYSKIWMKSGKIHDNHREELEIRTDKNNFSLLEKLFSEMGHNAEIKWFRKRKEYKWGDVTVCLDDTRGYGKIMELEKIVDSNEKEKTYDYLKTKLSELKIPLTPKEKFDSAYSNYKENWKTLINKK